MWGQSNRVDKPRPWLNNRLDWPHFFVVGGNMTNRRWLIIRRAKLLRLKRSLQKDMRPGKLEDPIELDSGEPRGGECGRRILKKPTLSDLT